MIGRAIVVAALALGFSGLAARAADVAAGEAAFEMKCGTCHSAAAGRNAIGPSLFGIVGRKAGTVPGFAYSANNKLSGIVWNEETLAAYIAKPKAVVGANKMTYAGIKTESERNNVVAYLATLH
jgi:cytochrome c